MPYLIIAAACLLVAIILVYVIRVQKSFGHVPAQNGLLADGFTRVKCSKCHGGMEFLTQRSWGKMDEEFLLLRRTDAAGENDIVGSPMANKRACTCCGGRGFHLYSNDRDYIPEECGNT